MGIQFNGNTDTISTNDGTLNVTPQTTFGGEVGIAGTLTYEDVTNIDSVGLVTARSGIEVSTGTATTALVVRGDARVTGILTVGTGSLTLDGTNNLVNVGTALTLGHTQGLQFHTQNLHSAGFEVNQINTSGIITATSFSGSGENLTYTTQLSHRNILHNGEFKVIQRYGTSFTINSTSDNEFTIDRWYVSTNDNLGNFTVSQSSDTPAGFRTSAKIQCTSTNTSSSSNEQSFIQQTVEAQNISHIFNGSISQPMTLSFYYKSNTTDQRLLWFYTPDTTRMYSALFTPSATNTWERFTISIPADTSNTINDDTGGGFYVRFLIDFGDTYGGGRPTSWSALSNDRYNGHTKLCTNTANNFYITGVQLEMGSKATPYEHRTISEELVNCQRYYYPYKSILKGASSGVGRPWIPVQMFLNDGTSSANDVFVVIAGLNEQRAKMRTGSAEVRVLAPLNSAPITTYPSAGEWAYFYRGQGSGFKSGGGAFTWNDGYYNMYGCRSIAEPRPTQIMIETNSEVGKVYVELDDEI